MILNEFFCSFYLGYEIGVYVFGIKGWEFGCKVVYYLLFVYGLVMKVLNKNSLELFNGIVFNFIFCYFVLFSEVDLVVIVFVDDYIN